MAEFKADHGGTASDLFGLVEKGNLQERGSVTRSNRAFHQAPDQSDASVELNPLRLTEPRSADCGHFFIVHSFKVRSLVTDASTAFNNSRASPMK